MRGRNPSADSAAGIARGREIRLLPARFWQGLGAQPPIAKQHSLFWRERRQNPGGLGAEPPIHVLRSILTVRRHSARTPPAADSRERNAAEFDCRPAR